MVGARFHGGDPTDSTRWELPVEFFSEYWFLVVESDLLRTNRFRRLRGESELWISPPEGSYDRLGGGTDPMIGKKPFFILDIIFIFVLHITHTSFICLLLSFRQTHFSKNPCDVRNFGGVGTFGHFKHDFSLHYDYDKYFI